MTEEKKFDRKKEFDRELERVTAMAEQVVRSHLPKAQGEQAKVVEAMNYSVTAGGKRLRPVLMWETFRMCGGRGAEVIGCFMAAIEMIHTYSLVHDDLPAMDNDRYRRGAETTWYKYGDAMGILAGDGLLNYAFETALKALEYCVEKEDTTDREKLLQVGRVQQALSVLAKKAGIHGMIGGQAVDIAQEENSGRTPGEEQLLFIHEHKTAALIQAAMMSGAILAGASREQTGKIEKCAYNVGIAFQIQDDILDVVGDSRELGKATGSDAENHKHTYVGLKGLERAREDVETLSREAAAILDDFPGEHAFLRELVLHLIYRRK